MGIQGIIRGKPHKTTIPDKKAPCPLDKVNRELLPANRTVTEAKICSLLIPKTRRSGHVETQEP